MITIHIRVYDHAGVVYQRQMDVNTDSVDKALVVGTQIAKKKRRELVPGLLEMCYVEYHYPLYEVLVCPTT